MSAKIPQTQAAAKQITVEDSWHSIQNYRPDAVIAAVKDLVE